MSDLPNNLLKLLGSGKVIPFIGAGVSMAVKRPDGTSLFPSWRELLLRGAVRLDIERKPKDAALIRAWLDIEKPDYLQAAAHLRKRLGAVWHEFLRENLDPFRREAAGESLDLARAVWRISRFLITTNFDRVLHWACRESERDDLSIWGIQARAEQARVLREDIGARPIVWHLHGRVDNIADLILTPDGCNRLYGSGDDEQRKYDATITTLRALLATHSLLFIGFSFDDPHLGAELQNIVEVFEGSAGPHYALVHHQDAGRLRSYSLPVEMVSFSSFGQNLIDLVNELSGFVESPFSQTLNRIHPPVYPDDNVRHLSEALEDAYRRQEEFLTQEIENEEVQSEILDLRRRIREGGHLHPGDFLLEGRFKLIEIVGQGGYASVWKSYDRRDRRLVAVKVLHGQFSYDRTQRERFFRGARRMSELQHEGVVQVLETSAHEGGFNFFVMEYVQGGNLRKFILNSRPRIEDKLRVLLLLGDALDYAHQRGLVHRDIKPTNVLVGRDGRPKLTDFDLVMASGTTGGTRTGMLGTVVYAAPEVMENARVADARSDVFGFGMTAIFVLFGSDLPLEIIRDAQSFVGKLSVGKKVRQTLEQAVAWLPEDRFESISSFCSELKGALGVYGYTLGSKVSSEVLPERAFVIRRKPRGAGVPFELDIMAQTLIGRDPGSAIVVNDRAVSREQCVIAPSRGCFELRDLVSTNGTFVNGVSVRKHALRDGDEIQIGDNIFCFETAGSIDRV